MALYSNYYLLIRSPEGALRTYRLPNEATVIGRDPGCAIFLNESTVSARHARLEPVEGGFALQDLGSLNGTFLAGENLGEMQGVAFPLRPNDSFRIGNHLLIFRKGMPASAGEPTAVATTAPPPPPIPRFYPYAGEMPPGLARYSLALLAYLPAIYQPAQPLQPAHYALTDGLDDDADTFLARFLALFESVALPIEWVIENFDFYLDPRTAPVEFFPWLESWYGLPATETLDETRRRRLLLHAHDLCNRKGSRPALAQLIELYTGCTPQIDDLTTSGANFRVAIKTPSGQPVDRALIERLIVAFKPVHTTYELIIT